MSLKKISATCGIVNCWDNAEKWACLDNRSTTANITVLQEEGGRCVMKSREMQSYTFISTGSGCRSPWGYRLNGLAIWQVVHWSTNFLTVLRISAQ